MQVKIMAAAIGGMFACAGMAQAAITDVSVTKANNTFISGTGIPVDQFNTSNSAGTQIGLKARGRDTGQPLSRVGSRYFVQGGAAASNPAASWWSFDFQFAPTVNDVVGGTNYYLTIRMDIDPGFSSTNFVIVSLPMFDADNDPTNSWDDTDGFFVNPGSGAWNTDDIDYVVSQSWRPDFSFLNGAILPAGEYDMQISRGSSYNGSSSTATIVVEVNDVPAPGAGVLAGMGLMGLIARRRRA